MATPFSLSFPYPPAAMLSEEGTERRQCEERHDGSLEFPARYRQRSFSAACPSPSRRKEAANGGDQRWPFSRSAMAEDDDGTSTPFLSSVQWIQQRDMVKQQQQWWACGGDGARRKLTPVLNGEAPSRQRQRGSAPDFSRTMSSDDSKNNSARDYDDQYDDEVISESGGSSPVTPTMWKLLTPDRLEGDRPMPIRLLLFNALRQRPHQRKWEKCPRERVPHLDSKGNPPASRTRRVVMTLMTPRLKWLSERRSRICQNERVLLPSIEPKVVPEDVCITEELDLEEHPEPGSIYLHFPFLFCNVTVAAQHEPPSHSILCLRSLSSPSCNGHQQQWRSTTSSVPSLLFANGVGRSSSSGSSHPLWIIFTATTVEGSGQRLPTPALPFPFNGKAALVGSGESGRRWHDRDPSIFFRDQERLGAREEDGSFDSW
nr:hypothetical protein Iba_chr15bCG8590 [Ipomoea batatas]